MNEIIAQIRALYEQYRPDQGGDFAAYQAAVQPLIDQVNQSRDMGALTAISGFTPTAIQTRLQNQQLAQQQQQAQGVQAVGQGIAGLAQLGMSVDAIRTANQAAQNSVTPSMPMVPGYNPQLSQQLYEAQRRANDIGYAVNPAIQQLNQGYTQAIGQAQAATGGQASNFQALANLANQQRAQAALGLVPLAQEARMGNQELVNQLLGQRLKEQQQMFDNQMNQYDYSYDRFNRMQEAIGKTGSVGRTNALDAITRLPEYLQYLPFGDEDNSFIQNTEMQVQQRMPQQQSNPNDLLKSYGQIRRNQRMTDATGFTFR